MVEISWVWTQLIGIFMTLAIISYVFRDNIYFRIAEYTYAGWSIGWMLWMGIDSVYKMNFVPLVSGERLFLIVPLVFGLIMFAAFSKKYVWLVRWPSALMIGAGMAISVCGGVEADITRQLKAVFVINITGADPLGSLSNIVTALMTAFTLMYFVFSTMRGYTRRTPMKQVLRIGRYVLMFGLGAYLGSAIMGDSFKFINRIGWIVEGIKQLFV